MNQYLITRRRFLRDSTLAAAGVAAATSLAPSIFAQAAGGVSIIVDPADALAASASPQWALGILKLALEGNGMTVKTFSSISLAPAGDLVIAASSRLSTLTSQIGVAVPAAPESLALSNGMLSGRSVVLVSGSDARGMVYAILELTDRVLLSDTITKALSIPKPIIEQTHTKTRSIGRAFGNKTEDYLPFLDKALWDEYLTMLAAERFNRLNWTTGLVGNYPPGQGKSNGYFCFVYPFLVSTGGVTVAGVSAAEAATNLAMLKYITDGCALRGLNFTLGIWCSNYEVNDILGLSGGLGDAAHANYSRDALSQILNYCPAITGLTFRVHLEGGIPEGNYTYWQTVFSAVTPFVAKGRRIEIDMHGKNVTDEHLKAALDSGGDPVISPKKTAEQSGIPYHHASIRQKERNSIPTPPTKLMIPGSNRYGYSNYFYEGRKFGVVHRLWPGTQRQLLWGDPAFAAGFGRAAYFCGSQGLEFYEPLSFHGQSGAKPNAPLGDRNSYADATLKPAKYDFHKHLYTYRVWGRCLYNPDTDPAGWQRFLEKKFGAASLSVETALGNASRILMMMSTIQAHQASWLDFWPEVFRGLFISDKSPVFTTDSLSPQRLTHPFDPQLFAVIEDYVEALLGGKDSDLDKYSPVEVAKWLEEFSNTALSEIKTAEGLVTNQQDPEFRRFAIDIKIQANLGLFFSRKWRATVLDTIYRKTNDPNAKTEAVAMYTSAINAWKEAATIGNVYHGFPYSGVVSGHWRDHTQNLENDLGFMKDTTFTTVTSITTHPGSAASAITVAKSNPVRPAPGVTHTPPSLFTVGAQMNLALSSDGTTESVRLYYRRVNQAEKWNVITMTKSGNQFTGAIPASYTQTEYPLQYYFALKKGNNSGVLFPSFNATISNQPYFHVRSVPGEVAITGSSRAAKVPAAITDVSVFQRDHGLEVHFTLKRAAMISASMYSLTGKKVASFQGAGPTSGRNRIKLKPEGERLAKGNYVLEIASEDARVSKKIIIR